MCVFLHDAYTYNVCVYKTVKLYVPKLQVLDKGN